MSCKHIVVLWLSRDVPKHFARTEQNIARTEIKCNCNFRVKHRFFRNKIWTLVDSEASKSSLIDRSREAEARCIPVGSKAIEYIASVWPVKSTVEDCKMLWGATFLTAPLLVSSIDPGNVATANSSIRCFFNCEFDSSSTSSSSCSLRFAIRTLFFDLLWSWRGKWRDSRMWSLQIDPIVCCEQWQW